jgi:pimeloyl-ACP methyl ester carboxylesterase
VIAGLASDLLRAIACGAALAEDAMQFVFVHGSFHGSWCWEHLIPLLERRGHRVIAPNLPGSGDDPAPLENADLDSYATRIASVIDGLPGRILLVGHSMAALFRRRLPSGGPIGSPPSFISTACCFARTKAL